MNTVWYLTKNGDILMWRNDESINPIKTVACVDPQQTFYPFLVLSGRITALSLFGFTSSQIQTNHTSNSIENKDSDVCTICYKIKANCVLYQCGHVFFCSKCKVSYENQDRICQKCHMNYDHIIEIETD
jgi:hypothetical protein